MFIFGSVLIHRRHCCICKFEFHGKCIYRFMNMKFCGFSKFWTLSLESTCIFPVSKICRSLSASPRSAARWNCTSVRDSFCKINKYLIMYRKNIHAMITKNNHAIQKASYFRIYIFDLHIYRMRNLSFRILISFLFNFRTILLYFIS